MRAPKRALKQASLLQAWSREARQTSVRFAAREPQRPCPEGRKLVVDLFCGIGGFSAGAARAGHVVVLAVDFDDRLLAMHRKNHPSTTHLKLKLGPGCDAQLEAAIRAAVPEGSAFHVHASPPCTLISRAGAVFSRGERQRRLEEGMQLVRWSLEFLLRLDPPSFSFEQVVHTKIDAFLKDATRAHPHKLDFAHFNFGALGVPQPRKRVLAGSPDLIARLRAETPTPLLPLSHTLAPPPGATLHLAGLGREADLSQNVLLADGTYENQSIRCKCYRSVHATAFTVCSRGPHRWCRPDHSILRMFTIREMATLQTFPESYVLSETRELCFRGIGNAFSPRAAAALMA